MKYKRTRENTIENRLLVMIQAILKLQSTGYYWANFEYHAPTRLLSIRLYTGKVGFRKEPIVKEEFFMDWVVSNRSDSIYKMKFEDFLKRLEENYLKINP